MLVIARMEADPLSPLELPALGECMECGEPLLRTEAQVIVQYDVGATPARFYLKFGDRGLPVRLVIHESCVEEEDRDAVEGP